MDAPLSWPQYKLNPAVQVVTDGIVPSNGVYLPSAPFSCAQYLIEGYEAWDASVLNNPLDLKDRSETRQPTTWTLIERIADNGGGIPGAGEADAAGIRLRCEAGQPCPREGYWFTPASAGGRHHFLQGVLMPDVRSDYGLTIWQWDEQQG